MIDWHGPAGVDPGQAKGGRFAWTVFPRFRQPDPSDPQKD
jgi:hypothetical protein